MGKPLCDANGVRGFPTLKYGDPNALDDYQGGRTFDAFNSFAKENLKPICSPANLALCDDEKEAEIDGFMSKSVEELDTAIKAEEAKLEAAEAKFKEEVEKLQATYQALMTAKDDEVAAVKAAGLGLMKSVKAFKDKETGNDEL